MVIFQRLIELASNNTLPGHSGLLRLFAKLIDLFGNSYVYRGRSGGLI